MVRKKKKKKKKSMGMKAYASFDLWAADQSPKYRRLIAVVRKLVNKTAPKLTETVKWGNGCHVSEKWPVIYYYAGYDDHLQFGFFAGAHLADPKRRLEGKGAQVRHVKIRSPKDIDGPYFASLIRQAIKLGR